MPKGLKILWEVMVEDAHVKVVTKNARIIYSESLLKSFVGCLLTEMCEELRKEGRFKQLRQIGPLMDERSTVQ